MMAIVRKSADGNGRQSSQLSLLTMLVGLRLSELSAPGGHHGHDVVEADQWASVRRGGR